MALKRELIIISKDDTGNTHETKLPFEINTAASVTYEILDQAARKIIGLSNNQYEDAQLVQTISLSEELS